MCESSSVDSNILLSESEDYDNRFKNVNKLYANGKNIDMGTSRLIRAHVCIIGLGGVGSWVAEALARSGVGYFTLIDMDDICV